ACGVSSVDVHRVSISPEGRMRSTAPLAAPAGVVSGGRGVAGAGGPDGVTTAKLSVTVTSGTATGTPVPVGEMGRVLGAVGSFVLPSTAATKMLPSSPGRGAFTPRSAKA